MLILASPIIFLSLLNVAINEVAWMGTNVSSNDEWIELYNNVETSINLDGWRLTSQDGSPKIILSGTIPGHGFYLLERTDDNTVPNIPADQIYTGSLKNTGETLKLFDNLGNLTDSVNDWFAGDNETKQTMERKKDGGWQTSQNSGGTPKSKNSEQNQEIKQTEDIPLKDIPLPVSLTEQDKPDIGVKSQQKDFIGTKEQSPKTFDSFRAVLLIASGLAIFSGIIIFIFKKRLHAQH